MESSCHEGDWGWGLGDIELAYHAKPCASYPAPHKPDKVTQSEIPMQWYTSAIPVSREGRQEGQEFKVILVSILCWRPA